MAPAKTRIRRSWVTYRNRFVEPVRIKAGHEFWVQNQTTLDRVAKSYGVPPSIIVAIIGVETIYGRNTGNFRVLDALARSEEHTSELQTLMRISYAVFCLKKKITQQHPSNMETTCNQ